MKKSVIRRNFNTISRDLILYFEKLKIAQNQQMNAVIYKGHFSHNSL